MKNKGRVLSLGLLVICFAIFAAGIYALKNASLNVSGTIGFTAHDCNILVYGKIEGAVTDPDDMSGEAKELYLVDYAGSGEFSQTEAFDFTGTLDLTFDANLWQESEGTYINAPKIYFNDSGDTAPDIVITLYLKNNSAYPVNVRVDHGISALEGVVEAKHTDLTRLENNVDEYSELKITLTLTDNSAEIDTSSKNFNPSLYFAKAKEQLPAPGNVTVDAENKTVTFDPVDGATGYEISYYKEGEESAEPVYKQTIDASSTTSVPLDFAPAESSNYVVKVRAYRVENEVNNYSAYSSVSEAINYIAPTSARYFTFDGSAVTGVVEDVGLDEIILPRSYNIKDGEFVDGTEYKVDTVKGLSTTYPYQSGFEKYSGSVVLLDNITKVREYAFCDCNLITKITIPASVKFFGNQSCGGCALLKEVYYKGTLNEWCNIDFAGNPCQNGATLYINDEPVTEVNFEGFTRVGQSVFQGCKSLKTVTIPDSVTEIGTFAFWACRSLNTLNISEGVISINMGAFGLCGELTQINLPDSLNSIAQQAFQNTGIQEITIPEQVTVIDAYTFNECESLSSVTFAGQITEIGSGAFRQCVSLSQIGELPDTLTSIGNSAFQNSGIQEITIPEQVSVINADTFYECKSLSNVTILGEITEIGQSAFRNCTSLNQITIPSSVTSFSSEAFSGCSNINNVYFQGTLDEWCNIEFGREGNPCHNGATLYVDNEPVTEVNFEGFTEVKDYVFEGCTSLETVILPKDLTKIGLHAFSDCTSLTKIILSKSVTSIDNFAFSDCKISKIYYTGTETEFDTLLTNVGSYNSFITKDRAYFLTTKETEPKPSGNWWYFEGETYNFDNITDSSMVKP